MNRRTILLAEDNPEEAVLTMHALDCGHLLDEVIIAGDGQECLDYLFGAGRFAGRDIRSMPALILLDLKMPRLGGLEVLRRVRVDKRTQHLPVVILTSSTDNNDLWESYRLGANSYIHKPIEFARYSAIMKKVGQYWLEFNIIPSDSGNRRAALSPADAQAR